MYPETVAETNKSQEYIKNQQLAHTHKKKNYYHRPTWKNNWGVKQDGTATRKINLHAAGSRVLLGKLTGSQLVKKFPAFYGTQGFITAFTSARHLPLAWARSIQSMPFHPTSYRSILILSSHLRLGRLMYTVQKKLDVRSNVPYPKSMDSYCTT
jgi:hypothetical protein